MASKPSPVKVSLKMMKGKPIATSVPVIKYRASDDELEELYPSTDDEEPPTPESEKTSAKSSPRKASKFKFTNDGSNDENSDKRSSSFDLSEGTPPSDPWKMLSDIRGKITKTFEEKLSEIKSEKKSRGRSRKNSSVSEPEDLGDITPTDDPEIHEVESHVIHRRSHARFRFSTIKTGLKAEKTEDSVESGVEAAEAVDVDSLTHLNSPNEQAAPEATDYPFQKSTPSSTEKPNQKPDKVLSHLKTQVIYRLLTVPFFIALFYYLIPLPEYIAGLFAGMIVAVTIHKIFQNISQALTMPIDSNSTIQSHILEIPAAEEHAVVEKFEGWLNELPCDYIPANYHVARTQSVYFKLEGDSLKVMETRTRIPKRAIWNAPQPTAKFTRKRVYSLTGATVQLLPVGLTKRRRWSKKYPICITLVREGILEDIVFETPSEDELEPESEKDKTPFEGDETDDDVSISKDSKDIFEDCRDYDEEPAFKIFIFGRTDRQKESWYRRLVAATGFSNKRNSIPSTKELTSSVSLASLSQVPGEGKNPTSVPTTLDIPAELSYSTYMSRYTDTSTVSTESNGSQADNTSMWLNALLGRILFDMHKCPDMINVIQDKIQRKLSNIKLPYFMESLTISELVIGQGAPLIHKATKPMIDERGLWIDLDISYECGLTMTVETKLNLMKLTRGGSVANHSCDSVGTDIPKPARSPMFDSDVEDSPETSTEDEDSINMTSSTCKESTPSQSSGRKFLNIVDKLAANKYFQHAAELSYIRRAMEGVSNTEIRLMVNVSSIEGSLSVNIPPPPCDRLWYGFKPIPKISLDAQPAVGERAVNIGYVTNWIKTKLLKEFDKVVVLPNMDDLVIPLCPNYPYNEN